jgi:hypothetical protein
MKKLLIGAVSAVALSFAFAVAPTSAAPGFNASKYCTDNGDFAPFLSSHGECVRYFTKIADTTTSNDAVAFCKVIQDVDPAFFDSVWKNIGQCVKSFH